MYVSQKNNVFNLEDTNGRSKNYYLKLLVYLRILSKMQRNKSSWSWGKYPCLTQYFFYENVIQAPEFEGRSTSKFNEFKDLLRENDIEDAFLSGSLDLKSKEYKNIGDFLDKNIEQKARHYTSNLYKLGLIDTNRMVTSAGKSLLGQENLSLSSLEEALPLKFDNLVIMRQLAKFKVKSYDFNEESNKTLVTSYSPFNLLITLLLETPRINESYLFQQITAISPYLTFNVKKYLKSMTKGSLKQNIDSYNEKLLSGSSEEFPDDHTLLSKEEFLSNPVFGNNKSSKFSDVYYEFYMLNKSFQDKKNQDSLDKLLGFLDDKGKSNKTYKRFNSNHVIFDIQSKKSRLIDGFQAKNYDNEFLIFGASNNFYVKKAMLNKRIVSIREYYKSFEKLLKISNVITVTNGVVSLTFPKLWESANTIIRFSEKVFHTADIPRKISPGKDKLDEGFYKNITLQEIWSISDKDVKYIENQFQKKYGNKSISAIQQENLVKKNREFVGNLKTIMPRKKLIEVLSLFKNRQNTEIMKATTNDADTPTIFEWCVAIAWYYVSEGGKDFENRYNLLDSMNLSTDSDGYPVTHAGGQQSREESSAGDIIVNYQNCIVQIEVTLMDKNAIKRGEWEPVLRHGVNLAAEEDPKPVQTYFVTAHRDKNTENIWRAAAQVDLEETARQHRLTRVVVYPLILDTLISWLNTETIDNVVVWNAVEESFKPLITAPFDSDWSDKIDRKIYEQSLKNN